MLERGEVAEADVLAVDVRPPLSDRSQDIWDCAIGEMVKCLVVVVVVESDIPSGR